MRYLVIIILSVSFATAQNVESFYNQSVSINNKGMIVLGSWGLANSIVSASALASNSSQKYFHQMNLGWGIVNTGISAVGYFSAKKKKAPASVLGVWEEHHKIKQTFLVNSALDLGYMTFGLYLKEQAKNNLEKASQLDGFGNAILLQGAGLAVFDLVMYGIQQKHYNSNKKAFEITAAGNGIGMAIKL